jgi:prepilin-type N-terminal cleavage/methylation domain-containing protein
MRERGFSLIETLAVLVVAGIMLSIGLPAFSALRDTLKERQAREELRQHMRAARQAAVTRHAPVIVAFGDGVHTSGITSYTVHVDTNGDRVKQSSEVVTSYSVPSKMYLAAVGFAPAADTLIFDPSGALWPGTAGGHFYLTGARSPDTLEISATGMVYRP